MRITLEIVVGCALSVLSACRTVSETVSEIETEVQYFATADVDKDETVEILIRNRSRSRVEFVRAELDGCELPAATPSVAKALKAIASEVMDGKMRDRMSVPVPVAGARWWQFYPSPQLKVGGYAVFQLNFERKMCPSVLKLTTRDGAGVVVRIPRSTPSRRRIEFLAFSGDGRTLLLRYSKGVSPDSVEVNGTPITFRVLEASTMGRPGVVVADLPEPLRQGDPTLVELRFPDGFRRFAFVRAMLGVCTDAVMGWDEKEGTVPESEREAYGFDALSRVRRLPADVACDDTRAHHHGGSARAVVAARCDYAKRFPSDLYGIDFCTALYPSVWNIYSQMADVVISKPYKLHWGESPARHIDEEDALLAKVVLEVAPRPVLWVPERFRRLRELDGAEYPVLAWGAMLRGVRGVRVHHWLNDPESPFDGNPSLAEAMKRFNADFNRLRPRLEKLVPVGESEDRRARVVVREGWCADTGVLLFLKNQRYDAGFDFRTGRRTHPFTVSEISDYTFSYGLPKWLDPTAAVDALTGRRLECETADGMFYVKIPELGAYSLVWIENAKKEGK